MPTDKARFIARAVEREVRIWWSAFVCSYPIQLSVVRDGQLKFRHVTSMWSLKPIIAPLLLLPVEGKASPRTKHLIEDQVLEAMELLGAAYKHSAQHAACKVLCLKECVLHLAIILRYRLNAMRLTSTTTPLWQSEKAYINCVLHKCSVLQRHLDSFSIHVQMYNNESLVWA